MLTSYRVRNFKSLVDIGSEFHPQEMNVLIGPNGSGKTSILQSIDFLRAFFMSSIEVYLQDREWDYGHLPNLKQTSKAITWDLTAKLEPNEDGECGGTYEYSVVLAPRRHLAIGEEKLVYSNGDASEYVLLKRKGRTVGTENRKLGDYTVGEMPRLPASFMSTLDFRYDRSRYPELLHFKRWVEGFRYYTIWDTKVLRNRARGKHEEIGPSGENLAPFLAWLKQKHPDRYSNLESTIRMLFPHVTRISVTGGRTWGWRSVLLHEDDVCYNSAQMSDGVLRTLAILSLLYTDSPPSVVMLEEPEDGIHPQLIREVVSALRRLTLRRKGRSQVFCTTHSPYVLDEFYDTPDEVFVVSRDKPRGGASVEQLTAARQLPEVRRALESHSLGEAWFAGVVGGTARPQP